MRPFTLPPLSAVAAPAPGAATSDAAAAAAAAPAAEGSAAGPMRLCLRRPGAAIAYFVLEAPKQRQQQQQQQQQALWQRCAAALGKRCGCCMGSLVCRRVIDEAKAVAAAAGKAATAAVGREGTAAAGEAAVAEETQMLSTEAALAALIQGSLDPMEQQLQRRLCHAAAPCEGWGLSVATAAAPSSNSSSAAATAGDHTDDGHHHTQSRHSRAATPAATAAAAAAGASVPPVSQQQQQQQQQDVSPSCCSFLLSVFDGHDSEVAAEFASQALPLLASRILPQRIVKGQEQQVAAAGAAVFAALDDSFRSAEPPSRPQERIDVPAFYTMQTALLLLPLRAYMHVLQLLPLHPCRCCNCCWSYASGNDVWRSSTPLGLPARAVVAR